MNCQTKLAVIGGDSQESKSRMSPRNLRERRQRMLNSLKDLQAKWEYLEAQPEFRRDAMRIALPVALTDAPGRAKLYYHAAVGCDSLGKDASFEQDAHAEDISTESLDNVLMQSSVGRVDVIKMDVQGAEELALRGAIEIVTSM